MHIFLIFGGVSVFLFSKLTSFSINTIFQWKPRCKIICHHYVEIKNAFGQISESDPSFHVQVTIVHIHGCMYIYMFTDSNIIVKYTYLVKFYFVFFDDLLIVMLYFEFPSQFFFLHAQLTLFCLVNDPYKNLFSEITAF